jgi:hypothetical protein
MKYFQSLLGRISRPAPACIILMIFFAAFLNQTILAGSNPDAANHSKKEMKTSPTAHPESPLTISSCEKLPMQCSSLCQTALSAESRAVELEKYSKDARTNADKAAKSSASIEKQLDKKLRKMGISKNTNTSASAGPRSESFWKTVSIVPRLLVSTEANARSKKEEKEGKQHRTNQPPDMTSQEVSELMMKSKQASDSAEGAQKVAADAKTEADRARANADSVRQTYINCLNGLETK